MHGEGWSARVLGDLRMRRAGSGGSEEFAFSDAGSVVVTVRENGGRSICKFFRWSVVDGRLRIGTNRTYDSFELVSFSASTIVVRRASGEIASFDVAGR